MAKKAKSSARKPARKTAGKPARHLPRKAKRRTPARRPAAPRDRLLADMPGAETREVGHVRMDVVRAGGARVKRVMYPAGFRWSTDMKPVTGTDLCMHGHVGFLARGEIHIEYPDGCIVEFKAPAVVAIDPGHDGWVVGREPVVLIEFDFERETIERLGLPASHRH